MKLIKTLISGGTNKIQDARNYFIDNIVNTSQDQSHWNFKENKNKKPSKFGKKIVFFI